MNDVLNLLKTIYANDQVTWLFYGILANLLAGIVASIKRGDFHFADLATWLTSRLIPLMGGYGAAAIMSLADPGLVAIREVAFATLAAALVGYLYRNLQDIGIFVPPAPPPN